MDDDYLIEPLPDLVSSKITNRIMACISYQPERRPDALDLLRSIKWHKAGLIPPPTPTPTLTPSASGTSSNLRGIFKDSLSSAGTGSHNTTLASAVGAHNPFRNMHIKVRTFAGKTIDLHLECARLVSDIMEEIQKSESTPLAEQCLFLKREELQPGRTIASYNIRSGSTLILVSPMRRTRDVTSTNRYPIHVKGLDGMVTDIDVGRSWTVTDLRTAIVQERGLPMHQLHLLYLGQFLEGSRTLSYYKIGEGSIISCGTAWQLSYNRTDLVALQDM